MNTENSQLVTEEQLKSQIREVIENHKDLVIETDEHYIAAGEAMKVVKEKIKFVEDWFKPQVDAAHKAHKILTTKRGEELKPLKEIYNQISGKAGTYQYNKEQEARRKAKEEEDRRRKEEEDKRLAEAARLEQQGKKIEAESVISKPLHVPPAPVQKAPKVSGLSFTKIWTYDIEDSSLIPREFMQPDTVKIGQYVKAMKESAKIPGVNIYQKIVQGDRYNNYI